MRTNGPAGTSDQRRETRAATKITVSRQLPRAAPPTIEWPISSAKDDKTCTKLIVAKHPHQEPGLVCGELAA
jgi:hypothetical protein